MAGKKIFHSDQSKWRDTGEYLYTTQLTNLTELTRNEMYKDLNNPIQIWLNTFS